MANYLTTLDARLLALTTVGDRRWAAGAVTVTLLGAWGLAWASGETISIDRHWFYVPVVIAAIRFTPATTLAVAVLAGLLSGPLVPLPDIGVGFGEHGPWIVRTLFLIAVGGLVAVLSQSVRRYRLQQLELASRSQEVAARQRDLALQRTAVVQTISHELRTPLTILKGTVETWTRLEPQITPDAAAELIPPMARATQRLESLIGTVLAASDIQESDALNPVTIEVKALLVDAVDRAGGPDGRAHVTWTIRDAPATVTTVPDYVTTALSLLIGNARKFSTEGGQVEVIASAAGGSHFEIAVRDDGPGLGDVVVERLFEPFTQGDQGTTREHPGLGMGLYTSRKLIRRIGGEVTIADHPEGGAVGRVILPLVVRGRSS